MRRVLVVVAALLVLLIGWFLFFREGGSVATVAGQGDASADAAEESAEALKAKKARERVKPKVDRQEAVSAFLAQWPEIGQDIPQDPKLGSIAGRVLAGVENPVAEAVVESSANGEPTARARTKGDGSFLLKNVPPGRGVAMTARAKDYAPGGCERLLVSPGQTLDVGVLYLGAALDPDAANRIEVRVVNAGGGEPVQGALVTATSTLLGQLVAMGAWEKQPGGTVSRLKTGVDGVAVFERLPASFYDVFCEKEGLTFVARQGVVVQRDTHTTIQLDVAPALTIDGKVVDEEGKPVADARVGVFRFANFTSYPATSTAEDGTFSIRGLPAGGCMLFSAKQGLGQAVQQNVEAGKKDVLITLAMGRVLSIRVTDAATGKPVREFTARPFQNGPFLYLYSPGLPVKTEDGVWRQPLDKVQTWGLEISAPGYAVKTISTVQLDTKDPVDVKLDPSAVVHGRVVAKAGGAPVRGARVYVRRGGTPPSPMKSQQTATDGAGGFVLDNLAAGPVKLTISHMDYTEESFEAESAPRGADRALPPVVEFALPSGGRISGHAFGPGRTSLAGQQITLMKDFFSARRQAPIAEGGAYEFKNLPPDKYTLLLGGGRGQRGDIEVTDGCDLVIDFGAESGGQKVTARLMRGEAPVADLAMTLEGGGKTVRARTDAQGRVAFEAVQPGAYTLQPSSMTSSASASVEVKADEAPAEVTLQLPVVGSIEIRVIDDATDKPLNGAWVNFEQTADASGKAPSEIRAGGGNQPTGDDGKAFFGDLEAGRYVFRCWRDPYGAEMLEDVPLAAGETKTGLVVRLGGAGTLSGKVKNGADKPIEGAAVHLKDMKGRPLLLVAFSSTSADGTFTQGQVKPGEYDVTIEKDGYAPSTQHVVVTLGKETRADFTLLMGGWIEVTALKADDSPMANAAVTLFDAAGHRVEKGLTFKNIFSSASNHTDASGKITLKGVAAGQYRVEVALDASRTASGTADVYEGAGTRVEVRLTQ